MVHNLSLKMLGFNRQDRAEKPDGFHAHLWKCRDSENIKVNDQNQAAKLHGILLNWHIILVNWTFQLTGGWMFPRPLRPLPHPPNPFVPPCIKFALLSPPSPALPAPISPLLICLPLLALHILFLCLETSELGISWPANHIPPFTVLLEPMLFWSFRQPDTGLPVNPSWLFLMLWCS